MPEWQINLPTHPKLGNTRKKKPASGWACCHIFPLFPHEVVSNTIKPPKPAKRCPSLRSLEFLFPPCARRGKPLGGRAGRGRSQPTCAPPGRARLYPLPVATPALPQALWSPPRGALGASHRPPQRPPGAAQSRRAGPVPGVGVAPAGKASPAPGGNDASGSCRRRPLLCLRLLRPWRSLGGLPLPLPGGRGRGGGLRASPARP